MLPAKMSVKEGRRLGHQPSFIITYRLSWVHSTQPTKANARSCP